MSLEKEIRRLSLYSMILTMARRRGVISRKTFDEMLKRAEGYFEKHPEGVAAAWRAFEADEVARGKTTVKEAPGDGLRYIEVSVDKRFVPTNTGQAMMLLRDKSSNSAIPIFVGLGDATAILTELTSVAYFRPLTIDLVKNILVDKFGVVVTKAVITECKEDIFYALLYMEQDGQEMTQDSRPSDAVALALRYNSPIFVEEELWVKTIAAKSTAHNLAVFEEICRQQEESQS